MTYLKELQYECLPTTLVFIDLQPKKDMLFDAMKNPGMNQGVNTIYYYHPDHLGSTSLVTDGSGGAVQYVSYLPYGEQYVEKLYADYDPAYNPQNDVRYKFTGKERDKETGYDYIEQRYYFSNLSIWTRVDPLVDKNIAYTPYNYCVGNPLKYIDPDGRDGNSVIPNDTEANKRINKNAETIIAASSPEVFYFYIHGRAGSNYKNENALLTDSKFQNYMENCIKSGIRPTIILMSCEAALTDEKGTCVAQNISTSLTQVYPEFDAILVVGAEGLVRVKESSFKKVSDEDNNLKDWHIYTNNNLIGTLPGDKLPNEYNVQTQYLFYLFFKPLAPDATSIEIKRN